MHGSHLLFRPSLFQNGMLQSELKTFTPFVYIPDMNYNTAEYPIFMFSHNPFYKYIHRKVITRKRDLSKLYKSTLQRHCIMLCDYIKLIDRTKYYLAITQLYSYAYSRMPMISPYSSHIELYNLYISSIGHGTLYKSSSGSFTAYPCDLLTPSRPTSRIFCDIKSYVGKDYIDWYVRSHNISLLCRLADHTFNTISLSLSQPTGIEVEPIIHAFETFTFAH